MINFRVASVDGMGDRDDIALESERQQSEARDRMYAATNQSIPSSEFADIEENSFKISDIVRKLVMKGGGNALYYNDQIFWDMDLEEARQEICLECLTPDGWDEPLTGLDQLSVIKDHGEECGCSLCEKDRVTIATNPEATSLIVKLLK